MPSPTWFERTGLGQPELLKFAECDGESKAATSYVKVLGSIRRGAPELFLSKPASWGFFLPNKKLRQ